MYIHIHAVCKEIGCSGVGPGGPVQPRPCGPPLLIAISTNSYHQ